MNRVLFLLLFQVFLCLPESLAEGLRSELPDPKSVKALENYWQAFDSYEKAYRLSEQNQKMSQWDQIRDDYRYRDADARDREQILLSEGIKRYQEHLEEYPEASNAPYVRLNLAQMYAQLASLKDEKTSQAGQEDRKIALALLAEVQKQYPAFSLKDEAQYLRATLLESMGRAESAFEIWQTLALSTEKTLFGAHAFLALGDHHFRKEKAKDALTAYQKGMNILKFLEIPDKDYELLRFQYRVAWSAYRSAELKVCIETGIQLLEPGRDFRQISTRTKVEKDATELTGDALFEQDDLALTKKTLQNRLLRDHSASIGLRVINRMMGLDNKDKLKDLGTFLVENFPKAKEMPDILTLLASVYKTSKEDEKYLATLERLSLLLPANSLWRNHHQNEMPILQNMEEKSLKATQLLANESYERGMIHSQAAAFKTAMSYYQNLLKAQPQHPEAESWRLKIAHCYYFSDQWNEADRAYEDFRKDRRVSLANLELASYQQILTREKMWRQSLQKRVGPQSLPDKDPLIIEKLRNLEKSIDEFADRFPAKAYTVDLLLLAASANRDLNKLADADRYWNRSLLSEASPAQRTLAIRGLIQSKIKQDNPEEVMMMAKNYHKLENWQELGQGFQSEIRGILAIAARDHAENLNRKGDALGAGQALLAVVEEVPEVNDYDRLYRDGAYYLALGGAWGEALKASEVYLAKPERDKSADLMYLKARSLEYQMRFLESAQNHLALVEKFPRYSRNIASVQRAEELALGESAYELAASAALKSVAYQKNLDQKYASIIRASGYFKKQQNWRQSLDALDEAMKLAKRPITRLKTNLEIARVYREQGDKEQAATRFRAIASEANRRREELDASSVASLVGEANYTLAEFDREQFEKTLPGIEEATSQEQIAERKGKIDGIMKYYGSAIASQDPEWSSRSRYGAGLLFERMSSFIKTAMSQPNRRTPVDRDRSLFAEAQRWQNLAQEYYSQNLVMKNREPHLYKNSIWVEKSVLKLSGLSRSKSKADEKWEVPASVGSSTPYMWSH